MTIPFQHLPYPIQRSLLEKFKFDQFASFHACSKYSFKFSEKTKNLFPRERFQLHFKDGHFWRRMAYRHESTEVDKERKCFWNLNSLYVHDEITDDLLIFLMARVRTKSVRLDGLYNCSHAVFSKFIETLKVSYSLFFNLSGSFEAPLWNKCSVDYITIRNAGSITVREIHAIKAKEYVSISTVTLSATDIVLMIKLIVDETKPCYLSSRFVNMNGFSEHQIQSVTAELGAICEPVGPLHWSSMYSHKWMITVPGKPRLLISLTKDYKELKITRSNIPSFYRCLL